MGLLHGLTARGQRLLVCSVLASGLWCASTGMAFTTDSMPQRPASVQVEEGDMASVLAFRLKPRGATIEQMMVALLRLNPDAFIQGNVNLLRHGAVLRLPAAEEVLSLSADQAREIVRGHHSAYLNNPEGAAPQPLPFTTASAPTPDETDERQALLERLRTAKARLNELQQNILELERLTQQTESSEPQPTASGASAAAPASAPASASASASTVDLPLSWIWLGVAAVIAFMVGVAFSRGRRSETTAPAPAPAADAAAQFQARLGALDLNLDTPSGTTSADPSK